MKNLKKYMAILTLVSVLGVSNAFASGVIPPSRMGGVGHSLSLMFEEVYEYFQDLFETTEETQTNDAIGTFTKPRPSGVVVNDSGVIPPTRR